MLNLSGYLTKNDTVQTLKKFVEDYPEYPNDVKIITCAFMGHGTSLETEMNEGDW